MLRTQLHHNGRLVVPVRSYAAYKIAGLKSRSHALRVPGRAIRYEAQHQPYAEPTSCMMKSKVSNITTLESEVTMTDAMSDDGTCDSESTGRAELAPQIGDDLHPHQETTIDLSGEDKVPGREEEPQLAALAMSSSPRSYQIEMLEESLRRNIIVAMDTGSGKTHIAIFRIIEELNHSAPEELVWFLAPTVDLCSQQWNLLKLEIPAIEPHIKLLQGNDGVERWKDKKLWDCVLENVRIIVSTPQILLEALGHAYVLLTRLSLLVFDEAHNCVGKSPGVKIMEDFYQMNKAQGQPVPHILGLSASPVMKSKDQSPRKIEEALDSICRTPQRHRAELMKHVNMPKFRQISYVETPPESEPQGWSLALHALHRIYIEYDMDKDPYIIQLRADDSERSQRTLARVQMKQKTWCFSQLKAFYNTSRAIFRELGTWAVDYYISRVVGRLIQLINNGSSYIEDWTNREQQHLCGILRPLNSIHKTHGGPVDASTLSNKVQQLIETLPRDENLAGIVFVQRRAIATVLAQVLSVHSHTATHFRIGTVVGASHHVLRSSDICDLVDREEQGQTLHKFRSGQLDLVIATTVLEEGIDIPACNLVLCFDEPANLKSFVQRRGRARMKESQLVLMQPSKSNKLSQWQELELEMKRIYADDMRELQAIVDLESLEEHDGREFRVESTGALLTLDNAVAHLYHFCALLPASQHVDLRPEFIYTEDQPAKIILPLCVDIAVREANGQRAWLSERNAKKDAAFEAYVALYEAGLVNDNLMPLLKHDPIEEELSIGIEKRPSIVQANAQKNPWTQVSRAWTSQARLERIDRRIVTVRDSSNEILSKMELLLPICIPHVPRIRIYWDATTEMTIDITAVELQSLDAEKDIQKAQNDTWAVLNAAFGSRFSVRKEKFVAVFRSSLETLQQGTDPVLSASQILELVHDVGLIRHKMESDQPYIFDAWLGHKPPASLVKYPYKDYETVSGDVDHLSVSKLPRRADFLHKIPSENQEPVHRRFRHVLPHTRCTIDKIPFRFTQFAMLIPSILHRLGVYMVGDMLSKTVLADVGFSNPNLVVTAISASSAMEETNYQRLEFLGDSLLKICTSLQLLAEYPLWHEGYLTARRDQVISNSRLARAALQVGLDEFIITAPFTGRKWRPLYVQDVLDNAGAASKRDISTKILADVVEALFGAAKLDGGMPKALACMRIFLPEIDWQSLEDRRANIFDRAPAGIVLPPLLEPLEGLLGYSFKKKVLLVEAMTHASCNSGTASLERLEFLGDAVLDSLIVNTIYNQQVELSHVEMHHLRTALVNADFLAFLCMEWTVDQETAFIVEDEQTHTFLTSRKTVSLALWKFMRRSSQVLTALQLETSNRHDALRDDINAALASGSQYPWALLSRLQAPKFYSDIVESLLGAVYIDSGSLDACEGLIERIGILPYLRRIIRDGVHIMHPKEELGILADMDTVKYVIGLEKKIVETREKRIYTCEIFVGETLIVTVNDGCGKEEVKTQAAELAVKILKEGGVSRMKRIMQDVFIEVVDDVMDKA